MTARRSLYGQSLLRGGQSTNFGSLEPQDKYYHLTKVQPEKISQDDKPGKVVTDEVEEEDTKYNFYVNTWTPTSEPSTQADSDENDFLDIQQLLQSKDKEKKQNTTMHAGSGLSAADIRGAVGVEEGISGLSSSTDNAAASKKQKQVEESKEQEINAAIGVNATLEQAKPTNESEDVVMEEVKLTEEAPVSTSISEVALEEPASSKVPEAAPASISEKPKGAGGASVDVEMKDTTTTAAVSSEAVTDSAI